MCKEQKKDQEIRTIYNSLRSDETNKRYKNRFQIIDNVVYYKASKHDKPVLVVPRHLRQLVLKSHHDNDLAAHVGRDKTFENIRTRFYWSGFYSDVQDYVNNCEKCIQHKSLQPVQNGHLQPIKTSYPFEIVATDIVGPFKTTKAGYRYVLICIDLFTSWVEAAPLRTLEASETADAIFQKIITQHGCQLTYCLTRVHNSPRGCSKQCALN